MSPSFSLPVRPHSPPASLDPPARRPFDAGAMPLIVCDITMPLAESEQRLPDYVARRLRVPPEAIRAYAVVRRAIDARRRDDIQRVYNVEVALHGGSKAERRAVARRRRPDVRPLKTITAPPPRPGTSPLPHRPIIVGFGPAGMFAALHLARLGYAPLVLERGREVRTRHRDIMHRFYRLHDFDPESNLLFGEGGAGAYSDGKLYTRIRDERVGDVLATLYHFGAKPEILTDAHPHIGSDKLPGICRRMRMAIEAAGGEVRFGARLDDVEIADGRVSAVRVGEQRIAVSVLLLCIGHSARDTVRLLAQRGVRVEAKPFQFGVRIEHPQELVDRWQYGPMCGHVALPPAEYWIKARGAAGPAGDVFSFCMCPGGMILPTNERAGLIATNGASRSSRSGKFANSGLVATIRPEAFGGDPLAGLDYIERWERAAFELAGGDYAAPAQRASDYLASRASDGTLTTTYPLGGRWRDLRAILPDFVADALARALPVFDRNHPGYAGADAIVTGPESRASSPVRLPRNTETLESANVAGLYPVGEGAGYAGGIISAAVDGLRAAEKIAALYAPILR